MITKKIAFTLAEVLITLGIIGVVAAMTLPTLVQKHKEKVTVTKVKKAYSVLSNAVNMAVAENGPLESWGLPATNTGTVDEDGYVILNSEGQINLAAILSKYMNAKLTSLNKIYAPKGGYNNTNLYSLTGVQVTANGKTSGDDDTCLLLPDGSFFSTGWVSADSSADISYRSSLGDTHTGINQFYFSLDNDRILLGGVEEYYNFEKYCSLTSTARENGRGCAAWIILHGNMEYLHSSGLKL